MLRKMVVAKRSQEGDISADMVPWIRELRMLIASSHFYIEYIYTIPSVYVYGWIECRDICSTCVSFMRNSISTDTLLLLGDITYITGGRRHTVRKRLRSRQCIDAAQLVLDISTRLRDQSIAYLLKRFTRERNIATHFAWLRLYGGNHQSRHSVVKIQLTPCWNEYISRFEYRQRYSENDGCPMKYIENLMQPRHPSNAKNIDILLSWFSNRSSIIHVPFIVSILPSYIIFAWKIKFQGTDNNFMWLCNGFTGQVE